MIEMGLIPVVNMHGSLGASGDIAPLAALALAMIGKGKVWLPNGETIVPADEGLRQYGLKPARLSYKEGLALLNGTSMMTSVASFTLHYLKRLVENSLVISAMSLEALRASKQPFDQRLHKLKPHRYQINTAQAMASILHASNLARTHEQLKQPLEEEMLEQTKVFYSKTDLQGGSYSLRAIPQVYHPILAAVEHLQTAVNTEINAVDDNPLIFPDEQAELHGANFHGYPISVASDSMNFAMIGVSNMALARIDRLLKHHHSHLSWFLATGKEGLFLGMHGIQFTAAGIGAELQNLAMPNSIVQISTNNDNQDFVSFGLQSTVKGLEMVILLAYVVAIEYATAGQGIWLNLEGKSEVGEVTEKDLSPVTKTAYEQLLRVYQPKANKDQTMTEPIEELMQVILLSDLMPREISERLWAT
jgi:histidine ammonia-lyase